MIKDIINSSDEFGGFAMKKSASDQVIDYIRERLISGEWTPGSKIATEAQLQKETGVSKASVREAVEKMVAMNLLTKRQGDGTYVNDITAGSLFQQMIPEFMLNMHDVDTILEFREIIEPACVKLFVHRFDEKRCELLNRYLEKMVSCVQASDGDGFYKADRDFHLMIAHGSQNSILVRIMDILNESMTRYHYTANRTIGARTGAEEHGAILDAIRKKDGELAALLMLRHLQRSRADMTDYSKNQSNDPVQNHDHRENKNYDKGDFG